MEFFNGLLIKIRYHSYIIKLVFPGDSVGKVSACSTRDPGDAGLTPVSGRSPGEGLGNPLQYACLENPMEKGSWWITILTVAKSQT